MCAFHGHLASLANGVVVGASSVRRRLIVNKILIALPISFVRQILLLGMLLVSVVPMIAWTIRVVTRFMCAITGGASQENLVLWHRKLRLKNVMSSLATFAFLATARIAALAKIALTKIFCQYVRILFAQCSARRAVNV
jgi:hypothetical protein